MIQHRNPNAALPDPEDFRHAPEPVLKAAKEAHRLQGLQAEAVKERDEADRKLRNAPQKDEAALVKAYADGGDASKIDPTRFTREAKEAQEQAQSKLSALTTARASAVGTLIGAMREHHEEWEAALLPELALAEGRLAELLGEVRKVQEDLNLLASLVKVARGGPPRMEGWSGGVVLGRAVDFLDEASSHAGTDGEPEIVAPFEALDERPKEIVPPSGEDVEFDAEV